MEKQTPIDYKEFMNDEDGLLLGYVTPKEKQRLTGYKKFMNDREVEILLGYVNRNLTEPIRLIFYLLIFVGIRVSEAIRLKESELRGNIMTFKLSKSDRIHMRVIPNFLVDKLNDYIARNRDMFEDGYLFNPKLCSKFHTYHKNPHIRRATIGWHMKNFRNKCNLNDVYYTRKDGKPLCRISTHTLRHWFLTRLYDSTGKDLILTAAIIGHKKISVTAEYITAWQKFKREEGVVNEIANFSSMSPSSSPSISPLNPSIPLAGHSI